VTSGKYPYNPLDRRNLGRSVEYALLVQAPVPLRDLASFTGAGIYALYYTGSFGLYQPVAEPDCRVPIYVGKADVPGARKGLVTSGYNGTALWNRLVEHAESLRRVVNLDLDDFLCRYLAVDDIWIPLGESLMIGNFRPLWNVVIDGFGLHDPGARRHGGLRSEWDELHPGRPWHEKMTARPDPDAIVGKVVEHFLQNPPPELGAAPTSDDE
jgi:hypothetical protein